MQFLNPLFWIGTLVVTVPILLHLVRREPRKRILFPSLMFLKQTSFKEYRRRKLSQLLLLFLRCLGLILLVGAFASPITPLTLFWPTNGQIQRSLVVLLDNSMSMSRPRVWERALDKAREKIRSLEGMDQACLVLFGAKAEVLSAWESRSSRLLEIIENRVKPSFESTSYLEGLQAASAQFDQNVTGRWEIHLITDLQESAMPTHKDWTLGNGIRLEVEDVGESLTNVFIQKVDMERLIFSDRYPQPVLIQIRATPPDSIAGELQIFVENQLVDRQNFDLGDEGIGDIRLQSFGLKEGVFRGKVVLDVEDSLGSDNLFNFVVEKTSPSQVRVFSEKDGGSIFLKHALEVGNNLHFEPEFVSPVDFTELDPDLISVVILDDLEVPPQVTQLKRYVEAGGGLILAPGKRVDAQAYNRIGIFPVHLKEPRFIRSRSRPFTSITQMDWQHPVFSIFQDLQKTALVAVQFYGYWQLEPQAGSRVLARFEGGNPALVEAQVGSGRVLVQAYPMDRIWSDFPLRPSFLPFWQRMVRYSAGYKPMEVAFTVGQSLLVREEKAKDHSWSTGQWSVVNPRGKRVVDLRQVTPGLVNLNLPGHYEIRKDKKTDWVAVNPDPSESNIESVAFPRLLEQFQIRRGESSTSALSTPQMEETMEPLWWMFLLGAAAVFGVESAVASYQLPGRLESTG